MSHNSRTNLTEPSGILPTDAQIDIAAPFRRGRESISPGHAPVLPRWGALYDQFPVGRSPSRRPSNPNIRKSSIGTIKDFSANPSPPSPKLPVRLSWLRLRQVVLPSLRRAPPSVRFRQCLSFLGASRNALCTDGPQSLDSRVLENLIGGCQFFGAASLATSSPELCSETTMNGKCGQTRIRTACQCGNAVEPSGSLLIGPKIRIVPALTCRERPGRRLSVPTRVTSQRMLLAPSVP